MANDHVLEVSKYIVAWFPSDAIVFHPYVGEPVCNLKVRELEESKDEGDVLYWLAYVNPMRGDGHQSEPPGVPT